MTSASTSAPPAVPPAPAVSQLQPRGAALTVLTQPVLWRSMTSFLTGWPFPLYHFRKQRVSTYTLHTPWRAADDSVPREFPHVRGAVLHAAIIEDNLAILQLAYEQSKLAEPSSTASSLLDVRSVMACAAHYGRLTMLQWLIEQRKHDASETAAWANECSSAMASAINQRDFSAMDCLFERCPRAFVPIPYDTLKYAMWRDDIALVKWAYDRNYAFDELGNYRMKHVMDHAASLAMLELLTNGARTDIGCSERIVDKAATLGDLPMLQFLHARGLGGRDDNAIRFAVRNGDLAMVQFLHEVRGIQWCGTREMDTAAARGFVAIVAYLHTHRTEGCTREAMDSAAANGHLDVVKFLHAHRTEGCTTNAMDNAAANGHLAVVTFLHEHRTEGCTRNAIDSAAANGHVDVVKFLHEHRSEGCTTAALHLAAANSHLEVALFLSEHRREGGKSTTTDIAAQRGWHDVVVRLLAIHSSGSERRVCTKAAIDGAASAGHLDVVALLHDRSSIGCTVKAMDNAASNGHLDVVKFLHAHRSEGCTAKALASAAANGHIDVVQFLLAHRSEGCASEALDAAVARGHDDVAALLRSVVVANEDEEDEEEEDIASAVSAMWQ